MSAHECLLPLSSTLGVTQGRSQRDRGEIEWRLHLIHELEVGDLLHRSLLKRLKQIGQGCHAVQLEELVHPPDEARHQTSLEAIRGHQRQGDAIRGTQRHSEALRGTQRQLEAIRGNQTPLPGGRGAQEYRELQQLLNRRLDVKDVDPCGEGWGGAPC